jgi:hypothetical protein
LKANAARSRDIMKLPNAERHAIEWQAASFRACPILKSV